MLTEIGIWLERIAVLLPQIIGLWEAAKQPDPHHQLNASMELVRAMKDRQAREEIGR